MASDQISCFFIPYQRLDTTKFIYASNKLLVFQIDMFGVHSVSITELLGITGYIIATVLGLWLVFSIIRSGKL